MDRDFGEVDLELIAHGDRVPIHGNQVCLAIGVAEHEAQVVVVP